MNQSEEAGLIFLKLGGSLITEKKMAHTARSDVLKRLAAELSTARRENPSLRLLLGHGSGSFGHIAAHRYGTRQGVHTPEQWLGFVEVWREAAALNQLVIDTLHAAQLPAIALPASAAVTAQDGRVASWNESPIIHALRANLLPVIYGDVIFDQARGGTIFSTEDLFSHLVVTLKPKRVLLAGLDAGVWADYPTCTQVVPVITPEKYAQLAFSISGSDATDVTGGMAAKVTQALAWVQQFPALEVMIFSGDEPGAVQRALNGVYLGTTIRCG